MQLKIKAQSIPWRKLMGAVFVLCLALETSAFARQDNFVFAMAVVDSMTNNLAQAETGADYTTYQARRLKLARGARFDEALHSKVATNALCGEGDDIGNWMRLECRMYKVLPYKDHCPGRTDEQYCVAIEVAPFVLRDPRFLKAVEDATKNPGKGSPGTEMLEAEFGVANLHAPGLLLAPFADRSALAELRRSGRTIRIQRVSESTFTLHLDRY